MNTSPNPNKDWRIGFRRNVPTLIWTGIIIILIGVFSGLIVTNLFTTDNFSYSSEKNTFGYSLFALTRFVLWGGFLIVILGAFMYAITRTTKPSD
jgi:hypothetical protein